MSKHRTSAAGIDTGKASLDIAVYPSGQGLQVPNTAKGYGRLDAWLAERGIRRVGIEASGGYEKAVVSYLRERGYEVAILQPRQVRAFAHYKLRRAKNDRIDAALIAECTANLSVVRAAPDPRFDPFAEHLLLIEQVEADIVCLQGRLERFTDKRLRRQLDGDIQRLERRRLAELARLRLAVCQHADLAARLDLIQSVDGVGPRTALALLILVPELGSLSREHLSALAGLAPFDADSGTIKGQRHIAGGRARVRRALFNAALPAAFRWNANLVPIYKNLTARGKAHKQALIACARKLLIFVNAVVQRGTPWTKNIPA